jgi:hypothetical protein
MTEATAVLTTEIAEPTERSLSIAVGSVGAVVDRSVASAISVASAA